MVWTRVKRGLKQFLGSTGTGHRILSLAGDSMPRVLVYHRFTAHGVVVPHRVSADEFAWQLDALLRSYRVIPLSECISHFLTEGEWPRNVAVITIDDGYRDMYLWAYPELRKRGLPATFFVTTRFIDGGMLLWPDRIEYAIKATDKDVATVALAGKDEKIPLRTQLQKFTAWKTFSDYCIGLDDTEKEMFITQVEELLLPLKQSVNYEEYSASSWDEIKKMHRGGIEIGGHTCTHPVLSKIDAFLLDSEIALCKETIQGHIEASVQSFCYPNSGPTDITDDVVAAVKRAGFLGAVFGTDLSRWDRYHIPRMGITNDRSDFLWKIHGGEALTIRRGTL